MYCLSSELLLQNTECPVALAASQLGDGFAASLLHAFFSFFLD